MNWLATMGTIVPGLNILVAAKAVIRIVERDRSWRSKLCERPHKELNLARTLINSPDVPFEPGKYRDTYRRSSGNAHGRLRNLK